MAKQKAINWPAIKKRYLLGEKPKDIGADYGLTSEQVRQKAKRDNWKTQKDTIEHKVVEVVSNELQEIQSVYLSLILDTGKKIKEAREQGLIGLTIQDGEGYSSKFADNDQKAGLALVLEQQKHANKMQLALEAKAQEELAETEESGFVGLPGINADSI